VAIGLIGRRRRLCFLHRHARLCMSRMKPQTRFLYLNSLPWSMRRIAAGDRTQNDNAGDYGFESHCGSFPYHYLANIKFYSRRACYDAYYRLPSTLLPLLWPILVLAKPSKATCNLLYVDASSTLVTPRRRLPLSPWCWCTVHPYSDAGRFRRNCACAAAAPAILRRVYFAVQLLFDRSASGRCPSGSITISCTVLSKVDDTE